MTLDLSYGLVWAETRLTPYSRLTLTGPQARAYRLGSRLHLADGLQLTLEGLRQEAATQPVDHGVQLQLELAW